MQLYTRNKDRVRYALRYPYFFFGVDIHTTRKSDVIARLEIIILQEYIIDIDQNKFNMFDFVASGNVYVFVFYV